ncbi:MAG TPA: c-type cytochrome [Thioploca sp.]|nr:c-type cytochrome [Thioploca sp.]
MIRKIALSLILGVSVANAAQLTELTEKCEHCHGENGNSNEEQVPSIASLSVKYFMKTMKKFKNDKRPGKKFKPEGHHEENDMNTIAKNLTKEDFRILADYYVAQTFIPRQQTVDQNLVRKGKKVYKRCKKCHTDNGSNPQDDVGILAGQWMPYLEFQLEQFSSGKRTPSKKMKKQLNKLQDGDIPALINFFAAQK